MLKNFEIYSDSILSFIFVNIIKRTLEVNILQSSILDFHMTYPITISALFIVCAPTFHGLCTVTFLPQPFPYFSPLQPAGFIRHTFALLIFVSISKRCKDPFCSLKGGTVTTSFLR
jgi:hypothetical protein